MKRKSSLHLTGFTLIELLIVVAIIAILAAIAVPNFLEAQVRAKVSRVKTDQRTLATAIESYSVDWNRAPIGISEIQRSQCVENPLTASVVIRDLYCQSLMTTPIAYVSSILSDPFTANRPEKDGRFSYVYHTYANECLGNNFKRNFFTDSYVWGLMSRGPEGQQQQGMHVVLWNTNRGTGNGRPYDPTNGTVSVGAIIRTNKGIFTGPGS